MPSIERISSSVDVKAWKDTLPLHYKYTAGIAGQRFMSGLKKGKIIASRCSICKTGYIPPKLYCTNCFKKVEDFEEVTEKGKVVAIANGEKPYCFVIFEGFKGGIVHFASENCKNGDIVKPVFKAEKDRVGRITDILYFEP
jgi:uncharacterized OB-fold protein